MIHDGESTLETPVGRLLKAKSWSILVAFDTNEDLETQCHLVCGYLELSALSCMHNSSLYNKEYMSKATLC
jgi:hypothetical protein